MSFDLTQCPSAFRGHETFCQWLVQTTNAKTVVELGVDYGWSFFHFAMSLPEGGTVYGIDDYSNPFHEGNGGYKRDAIRSAMTDNMKLWDLSFEDACFLWQHGTEIAFEIDVLLIDGGHSYENVREDFNSWHKFVRKGGVVLLHDLYSFPDGPGRFFNELPGYKFDFKHSHGLGVWTKP